LLELALPEYQIDVRRDAESALTAAPAFQPELFILDVILPGMTGTTLAARLRETGDFAETPIFLISGLVQGAGGNGGPVRVNGVAAFAKPFSFTVFKQHVQLHLAGRRSSEAALQLLPCGRLDAHGPA
jgi:DNA-binding response OmpR family regulator